MITITDVDKTYFIALVENTSRFFFFVRPRRFGKSLFLNMLGLYYDINKKINSKISSVDYI
ncbi:AAA family ATPase [Bacteroides acidifaciens]|uniref:AAA family ATPase n=1 Tax=Bacteroides acidifaciens TaxID=85831 RepID=UPI0020CA5852|nr:AAA family ATPase [Bacteroides acidifaciens]